MNSDAEPAAVLRAVFDACVQFDDFMGYLPKPAGKWLDGLICKHVGLVGLSAMQRTLAVIAPPIEEQDRQRLARSPVRWEGVKRDSFYFGVMLPALGLFHGVRLPTPNWTSGIDLRSGNRISPKEERVIRALPPLADESLEIWAKLIVKLTLSGDYWAQDADLNPGGKLYQAIAARAVRNRKGKRFRQFRQRFGVLPPAFLALSVAKKCEVRDHSPRAGNEPLSEAKATRVTQRAEKIVAMTPTPDELKRELSALVIERLKTLPRK